MKWFLLISALTVVNCRPQNSENQPQKPTVEVQKQDLLEIHPEPRQLSIIDKEKSIEEQTKQILENIAEVNRKHGFTSRKRKPDYFHFPYSYSRSQGNDGGREAFRFANNPYGNPIFDYLTRVNNMENSGNKIKVTYETLDDKDALHNRNNDDIIGDSDEVPPGHYIKRKIIHQQTIITPIMPNIPQLYQQPQFYQQPPYLGGIPNVPNHISGFPGSIDNFEDIPERTRDKNKTLSNLEKETIDNIKHIVMSSQYPQSQYLPVHLNPYRQPSMPYNPYSMQYPSNYLANLNFNPTIPSGSYNYQLYGPYVVPGRHEEARQQFQWPWAQFFPITIRDPMVQMMNAFTSMVEFGQRPGNRPGGGAGCRHNKEEERDDKTNRTSKSLDRNKLTYEIKNINTAPEVIIKSKDESPQQNVTTLDIEDLIIKSDKSDPKKTFLGFKSWKTQAREAKVSSSDVSTKVNLFSASKNVSHSSLKTAKTQEGSDQDQKRFPLPFFQKPLNAPNPESSTQHQGSLWLPIRGEDQPDVIDEKEDEVFEDEKDVTSVSHDGNKKLFSKDNTGSGIFIHKLKVRKGGVAIAGPGGIATAGSGGTAIVGPNGYAYTHPDSIAIAGSGTKVVAVDPSINLSDLINVNSTRKNGNIPRVGKVVAIGPVVYYNKGYITFPNGLRFPKWLPQPGASSMYFGIHQFQFPAGNFQTNNIEPFLFASNIYPQSFLHQHYSLQEYTEQLEKPQSKLRDNESEKSQQSQENSDTVTPEPVIDRTVQIVKVEENNKNQRITIEKIKNTKDKEDLLSNEVDSEIDGARDFGDNDDSLAPYREHSLFNLLKQQLPLGRGDVIRIENNKSSKNKSTLILKPVARAVAGVDGTAISTPISRAILREGANVDILFEPEAIAIAGPGGVAHAESDLEITYEDIPP